VAPPVSADGALQHSVRRAIQDETAADGRLRVTYAVATCGWGDVLFVDVYARSRCETLEDLDPALRLLVSVVANHPFERVTIRWRISH
jgi:hypothetical protein